MTNQIRLGAPKILTPVCSWAVVAALIFNPLLFSAALAAEPEAQNPEQQQSQPSEPAPEQSPTPTTENTSTSSDPCASTPKPSEQPCPSSEQSANPPTDEQTAPPQENPDQTPPPTDQTTPPTEETGTPSGTETPPCETPPAEQPQPDPTVEPDPTTSEEPAPTTPPCETTEPTTESTTPEPAAEQQPAESTLEESEEPCGSPPDGCTATIVVENSNDAEVKNGVVAVSNTGDNTANAESEETAGSVAIQTGEAGAFVVVENDVNRNETLLQDPSASSSSEISTAETASPSVAISDEPWAEGTIMVSNENQAVVANTTLTGASSGTNQANGNDISVIGSGDVTAVTTDTNIVNTNITGSDWEEVVFTILDTFTGDINLVDILLGLLEDGDNGFFGDLMVNNQSTAEVTNSLTVEASSGNNQANENNEATIETGDVNVITNLLNIVNSNIIGSNFLLATINILGTLIGDIILPGEGVLTPSSNWALDDLSVTNANGADILNTILINATSGDNLANGNSLASLETGDVQVGTRVSTIANTNIINNDFLAFVTNNLGVWVGDVINGSGEGAIAIGQSNTDPYAGSLVVVGNNQTSISNTITINANSGANQANDNDQASIKTGKVAVATNVLNIANTNVVGSNWFFGNLNLLGTWKGNLVFAYPDLAIKNNHQDTAHPGDLLNYTLRYSNQGLAPAKTVTIVDAIPEHTEFVSASDGGTINNGLITWNITKVPAQSEPQSVTFTVQVDDDLPVGDTVLQNQAAVASKTKELELTNNIASSQTVVNVPDPNQGTVSELPLASLSLSKSTLTPIVMVGEKAQYEVTVSNTGNVELSDVVVSDTLPGLNGEILYTKDFNLGILPAASSMKIEYTLVVAPETPAGFYTNHALAKAQGNGVPVTSSESSSTVEVQAGPATPTSPVEPAPSSSQVTPTETQGPPLSSDETDTKPSVAKLTLTEKNDVKESIQPGGSVTFTVTASNDGTEPLSDVVVQNVLTHELTLAGEDGETKKTDWKLGSLDAGDAMIITYTLALPEVAPAGTYTNISHAQGLNTEGKVIASNRSQSSFLMKARPVVLAAIAETSLDTSAGQVAGLTDILNAPRVNPDVLAITSAPSSYQTFLPWWIILLILGGLLVSHYRTSKTELLKRRDR